MPDEFGQTEDDQRHREYGEADRHHRTRDLTREDDHAYDELGHAGEPDERRIRDTERTEHVEERALVQEGLRERRIEQLLGQRAVRDAETHRESQQVDRGSRPVLLLDRAMRLASPVERRRAGPRDEQEDGDAQDVDLLEDVLDAERDHRDDPEEREHDRHVSREKPSEQEQSARHLHRSQRDTDRIAVEDERGHEEPIRGGGGDEREAKADAKRKRTSLGVALKRAEPVRLGNAVLYQVGDTGGAQCEEERGDDRQAEEASVLRRMQPWIGEPLDVGEDADDEWRHR